MYFPNASLITRALVVTCILLTMPDWTEGESTSTCEHNGKTYKPGQVFMDDCKYCRCHRGEVVCTKNKCPPPVKAATTASANLSTTPSNASTTPSHTSGPNSTSVNGPTDAASVDATATSTCEHNGKTYKSGQTWGEDCKFCRCYRGKVLCTNNKCPTVKAAKTASANLSTTQNNASTTPSSTSVNVPTDAASVEPIATAHKCTIKNLTDIAELTSQYPDARDVKCTDDVQIRNQDVVYDASDKASDDIPDCATECNKNVNCKMTIGQYQTGGHRCVQFNTVCSVLNCSDCVDKMDTIAVQECEPITCTMRNVTSLADLPSQYPASKGVNCTDDVQIMKQEVTYSDSDKAADIDIPDCATECNKNINCKMTIGQYQAGSHKCVQFNTVCSVLVLNDSDLVHRVDKIAVQECDLQPTTD